jgi:hypothetical protein
MASRARRQQTAVGRARLNSKTHQIWILRRRHVVQAWAEGAWGIRGLPPSQAGALQAATRGALKITRHLAVATPKSRRQSRLTSK